MILNDPLGDLLTRIRNAQMRRKPTVCSPASKLRLALLGALQSEGYIRGFETREGPEGRPEVEVSLKYHDGKPAIRELQRVSKPGRRVYARADKVPQVRSGLGVAILSTSRGVMTDSEAFQARVGGEVLCRVF
jgi:small subunit ribosomal protein S8